MFHDRISKGDLVAVDSTRSVTHGAKRFIKNVLGEMFNIKSRFHMDVVEKGYIAKAIFGVKL